jgi:ParB/RepB/Spo0J family partition protein
MNDPISALRIQEVEEDAPQIAKSAVQHLPLELVVPSPTNPRRHIDLVQIEELAANILAIGLIEPIVVRPVRKAMLHFADGSQREVFITRARLEAMQGELPGDVTGITDSFPVVQDYYEIAAGERRYRAHCHNADQHGWGGFKPPTIAAIVRELTDEQMLDIQVSENLQREDLTALDWAAAYRAMVDVEREKGSTQREAVAAVAARLGKSVSYIDQAMQLLKLCDEAQRALRKGWITKNHGIDCARLTEDRQREYLCEAFHCDLDELPHVLASVELETDCESVREMREWIQWEFGDEDQPDENAAGTSQAEAIDEDTIAEAAEMQRGSGAGSSDPVDFPVPQPFPASAKSQEHPPQPRVDVNTAAEREAQARQREEDQARQREEAIKKILTAAHSAAKKRGVQMLPEDLRLVCRSMFLCAWQDCTERAIVRALQWPEMHEVNTLEQGLAYIDRQLAKMDAALLPQFLLLCSLGSDLMAKDTSAAFAELQSRYRVSLAETRAELRGEHKPKPAAKPAAKTKTPAKPTAKAKPKLTAKPKAAPKTKAKAKKAKGRAA